MCAFSHKFSTAPSGETTDWIKKVREGGAKMGRTSSITMPSMVGIVGRAPAMDQKVWCFFYFSRFRMTKFVITETLLSTVIVKTIIVLLRRGRFVVVHLCSLCSSFPIDPQNFPRKANFYQKYILPKITIFGDFWDRKATFLQLQWSNLAWKCSSGTPSPR